MKSRDFWGPFGAQDLRQGVSGGVPGRSGGGGLKVRRRFGDPVERILDPQGIICATRTADGAIMPPRVRPQGDFLGAYGERLGNLFSFVLFFV